jgi:SSS family solute:Na+ symporter
MFAAYLKLLMPFVVVLPGICAAVIYPTLEKSDQAYPMMMSLLPNGLLGLTFAALVAAIVSSLASMTNSISTIFTMDIFRSFVKSKPSEQKLVNVGRNTAWISLFIAVLCAQPLLGSHGICIPIHSKLYWVFYSRNFSDLFGCLILEKSLPL